MALRLSDVAANGAGDEIELSARLDSPALGWRGTRLWFRVPRALAPRKVHADPFAVALLLPAMAAGEDLAIEGTVSPSLLGHLDRAQSVVTGWNARNPWARLRRVRVNAAHAEEAEGGAAGTGLFFTGGVDSLYSLRHATRELGSDVDRLLYVHGYDVPIGASGVAEAVQDRLLRAAEAAARPISFARTNMRDLVDPILSWEMQHGAALAAVGHAAGRGARRWVISSADAYISGAAYGTAEALDPLWSREHLRFVTGGAGLDRLTKLAALTDDPIAHRYLLVCWQRRQTATNCGRCAKCVRTALQLRVLGALDRFDTLPHEIDPSLVAGILAEPAHRAFIWRDLRAALGQKPHWAPLAAEVERLVQRTTRALQVPRPGDLATAEGRRLAALWLRRRVQPLVPARARMHLKRWQVRQ